ncbi:MAG: SDR family oxidoreductase [Dehalococcoidia bacterium]|nr:SDR family oxidoreductase [Dehalococcoidia bacterium]
MGLVNMRLDGKVALVVGGAKNLGKIECMALAEAGADIAIIDIAIPEARETANEIRKATKRRVIVLKADVRSTPQIDRAVQKIADKMGSIDVMVYNAGTTIRKKVWDMSDEDWDRVLDINLTGAFVSARATARQMIKQGKGGKIINISTMAAFVGEPDRTAYCASKGGMNLLTKALAIDLAPHNIQVNGICPGVFDTGLVKETSFLQPAFHQSLVDRTLYKRRGWPHEIAGITVFLSTPASDYITGDNILLDGGMLAH